MERGYKGMNNAFFKASQLQPITNEIPKKKESYMPMLHGKATDAIALMPGIIITENRLNNTGIIDAGGVRLVISKLTELSGTLGVSTHKILSTAIALFTEHNHTGNGNQRAIRSCRISIPLKEYLLNCGYDVEEHLTETKEEAEKEAKRVKMAVDNARKKIKKDLLILKSSSLTWTEKIKGKSGDFADVGILGAVAIKNGYIHIEFTLSMAEYLINLPLTQYPISLLGVDERNNNAYSMGLKMAEHFNLDNNQIKGNAQFLKVKTLLAYTDLPSVEDCKRLRRPFTERIEEPFENALDELTRKGFLKDWEYCHPKGVSMTDEEATAFGDFEEWANTLVHFTLKDAPVHTARLEARAEEKKTRQSKKTKKQA